MLKAYNFCVLTLLYSLTIVKIIGQNMGRLAKNIFSSFKILKEKMDIINLNKMRESGLDDYDLSALFYFKYFQGSQIYYGQAELALSYRFLRLILKLSSECFSALRRTFQSFLGLDNQYHFEQDNL